MGGVALAMFGSLNGYIEGAVKLTDAGINRGALRA
jgi:hypothetical protein